MPVRERVLPVLVYNDAVTLPAHMAAEGLPTNRPVVLDHRSPSNASGGIRSIGSPLYPLIAMGACAAFGLLSPQPSSRAEVAGLLLIAVTCWYVVARICRDHRTAWAWRALLSAAAVGSILTVWVLHVDYGMPLYREHWRAYGRILPQLYALAGCVAGFAALRVGACAHRRLRATGRG